MGLNTHDLTISKSLPHLNLLTLQVMGFNMQVLEEHKHLTKDNLLSYFHEWEGAGRDRDRECYWQA